MFTHPGEREEYERNAARRLGINIPEPEYSWKFTVALLATYFLILIIALHLTH